jgi:hypothetical protein
MTIASLVGVIALSLLGRARARQSEAWPWLVTGLALGGVGLLAWVSGSVAGWGWGLSITGPSRSLIESTVLGMPGAAGWGTALVVGIPLGTWLSARAHGPVTWRAPGGAELSRRFTGDVLMGFGGTLAAGCNIGNALTGLGARSQQRVRHRRHRQRRLRGHRLAGNTSAGPWVAHDEGAAMMKQYLGRLTWPARIVVLGGILLLAARIGVPSWTDADSSMSGPTTLASCVLPATVANDPASTPASVPEPMSPDCEASMPDRLGTAWMAC